MAGSRREWKDKLREECIEKQNKKPKILILEDIVIQPKRNDQYEAKSSDKCNVNKKNNNNIQFAPASPKPRVEVDIINKTPHQLAKVEHLTPTFRKPKSYIEATNDVMKNISPVLNENNLNVAQSCDHNIFSSDVSVSLNSSLLVEPDPFLTFESTASITKKYEHSPTMPQKNNEQCEERSISSDKVNCGSFEVNVVIETHYDHSPDEEKNKRKCSTENVVTDSTLLTQQFDLNKISCTENLISNSALLALEKCDSALLTVKQPDLTVLENEQLDITLRDEIISYETKKDDTGCAQAVLDIKQIKEKKVRKSKRKLHFNVSYLDFMADDSDDTLLLNEAFPSESSSFEVLNGTSSSDKEGKDKKRKKKKKNKKQLNKEIKVDKNNAEEINQLQVLKRKSKAKIYEENSAKKKKGESYVNRDGHIVEGKSMKPNPCTGTNCCNKCENILEERRENLFQYFWGLGSHQRRKDWISQCAIRKSTKRPDRKTSFNRSSAFEYYINEGEGRRRVCQKFLIHTLDITQKFILYTLNTMVDGFAQEDMRGKTGNHNKTPDEVLNDGQSFIMSLPLLPSHYCRRDSNRLYLPEEFKNITNLYRIYQNNFSDGRKIMSFKVFSTWFKKTFNIGFHIPKKDKCTLCLAAKSFDVLNEEQMEKLKKHEEEKEESYKRFKFHQNLNTVDKTVVCASFDLQKVLNTPHGDSMILYYSRKIAVYNFTIYESGTQKGFCYIWSEIDGHRGANEIATCVFNYIRNLDQRGDIKKIIFYCDSAYGQNKNKTVLAMLRYALHISENLESIQINYLIPGHTYMPVDSMHATIETSIKKTIVWAPSQWPTIIEYARKNPEPFHVDVLNGVDFLGFEDIVEHTFKKNQKLQISKIATVTIKKNKLDLMSVKYSMLPNAETSEITVSNLSGASLKTALYPSQLPICTKKYNNLKKLVEKQAIPKRFANEYLNLKNSSKVADCLPDTDEEDNII